MLKSRDLFNCSIEELEAHCRDLCKGIFVLTNELHLSRSLKKPHQLQEKRRDRARVLTILRKKRESEKVV